MRSGKKVAPPSNSCCRGFGGWKWFARVLEWGGKEGEGCDELDDSDIEEDLQIVLNDNTRCGIMGMDNSVGKDDEDDNDGDNLVIVVE
ncbi:hypothetical protein L1887_03249 [Cichorium endivia]|nr:hypothetical protein L1887_03249 [Cichorium endivia]